MSKGREAVIFIKVKIYKIYVNPTKAGLILAPSSPHPQKIDLTPKSTDRKRRSLEDTAKGFHTAYLTARHPFKILLNLLSSSKVHAIRVAPETPFPPIPDHPDSASSLPSLL